MAHDHCPSGTQLVAFHLGDLPEATSDAVGIHLEDCPRCAAAVENLDPMTDPVLAALHRIDRPSHRPSLTKFLTIFQPPTAAGPISLESLYLANYEILGELGRGGMGIVYKARQINLNRLVAVKVLASAATVGPEELLRFQQEAEAVACLQHPNLVQVFEVGRSQGRPFLVMEFVEGGALEGQLDGTPQPVHAAAELVETLARAVEYAHRRGIVHRDLKPANVLLPKAEESGGRFRLSALDFSRLKITDFGLAKRLDADLHLTEAGTVAGTPTYMAPEQADPKFGPIGPGCDVYSLGVILYQLLIGRVPLEGETSFDTLTLACKQDPVALRQLQPKIPRNLETICLKCLHKEPGKRYASAAALADDLRRFLEGRPIVARPASAWERTAKWARRQPAVAALLVLVLLSTTLGFSGVVWQWQSAVSERNRAVGLRTQADAARERAEDNVYFSRVSQARLEWQLNHNAVETARLLERCAPEPGQVDRRGWEWHLLRGSTNADLFTLQGHSGGYLEAVAFSPDGQLLASAGGGNPYWNTQGSKRPGEVVVWDVRTGAARHTLRSFTNQALTIAFSPDGQRLVAGGLDPWVQLWDVKTGQPALKLDGAGPTRSLAISPNGLELAIGKGRSVVVYDLTTKQPARTLTGNKNDVTAVAYSADGRWLAAGGDGDGGNVKVWDARSGQEVAQFAEQAGSLAFSPDGNRLATAHIRVSIWDLDRRQQVRTFGVTGTPQRAVAFRPDGLELATASSDRTVRLWDPHSGAERGIISGHRERVRSVAYHPAGYMLASGDDEAVAKVWDLTRGADVVVCGPMYGHCDEALAFSPDGGTLMRLPGGGGLAKYDAGTGRRVAEQPLPFTDVWRTPATLAAFSGDGRWLAGLVRGQPEQIRVWEAQTGQPRTLSIDPLTVQPRYGMYRLALDHKGERLAAVGLDGQDSQRRRALCVWDLAQEKLLLERHVVTRPIRPGMGVLALSPDGNLLAYDDEASGAKIRVVQVNDGQTRALLDVPDRSLLALTFSPDGRYLAGADFAANVRVWDTNTWKPLHAEPLQAKAFNLAFDPTGRLLAAANREELKVWDVASGQTVQVLRGVPPRPSDGGFTPQVAWSPDGRRLALSNWDGTASIWDAADRTAAASRNERRLAAEQRAFVWHAALAKDALERNEDLAFAFHWRHLRNAAPFDLVSRRARGDLYAKLGQLEQALADYEPSFVGQLPGTELPWLTTVCLRALCGQQSQALEMVGESRRVLTPGVSPSENGYLTTLWSVLEDPEADTTRPLALMKDARAKSPNSPQVLFTSALASYRAGKLDDARRQAEAAYDKDTAWNLRPSAWVVQALAWQAQGEGEKARRQLTRAEEWLDQHSEGKPFQILRLNVYEGMTFLLLLQEAQAKIRPPSK